MSAPILQPSIPQPPGAAATEIGGDFRFGKRVPLSEGLRLLAGYLAGLPGAIDNHDLRISALSVIPHWAAYVRGMRARLYSLADEVPMPAYQPYTLSESQRTAVIASIRKNVADDAVLAKTPDDLLLPILHCLTGRTSDLVRHVAATAARLQGD